MIDIHSHILYGVDDGAKNQEISIQMLKIAEKESIESIIATPHYISGIQGYNTSDQLKVYEELKETIKKNKINIKLYIGNEILINENIVKELKEGKCRTLNNTKYVLVELPMANIPIYTENILYSLIKHNYIPIIAHPERNANIIGDVNILKNYIEIGALAQINTTSIVGLNGKMPQEIAKKLILMGQAHFVATDSHTNRRRSPKINQAFNIVKDLIGEEKSNIIFKQNAKSLIKDQPVQNIEPTYIKKTLATKIGDIFRGFKQGKKTLEGQL